MSKPDEALRGDILVMVAKAVHEWRAMTPGARPTLQMHIARAVFAWVSQREAGA